uniref:Tyr recombinase domain-containing protein n=1 Tax=Amphimedon queenslandica TaxID=400682 RepID=A0A1X7UVJ6_AMPQE
DGNPLTRDQFVRLLRDALSSRGIDSQQYSGHSFRIGAATAAAQANVPDHLIKVLGRWRSEAYQIYIQTPPTVWAAVSTSLAKSATSHSQSVNRP